MTTRKVEVEVKGDMAFGALSTVIPFNTADCTAYSSRTISAYALLDSEASPVSDGTGIVQESFEYSQDMGRSQDIRKADASART